jgi:cytochrome c-type biogenesis protein CcmF
VAALGTVTLLLAYVVAAYAAATGMVGSAGRRPRLVASSVQALYGFCGLMGLASALIVYAFVTHDYTIKYVAHYSDTTMPIWYKITAYWGGLDGSLMFWVSVLAGFAAVAVRLNRQRHREMIGYVVTTIMVAQLFFLSLLIYSKNPFATFLTTPPADGKGLNPLLQNYWMVIHPPSLYVGFVAATIPFAFGIGALASGRLDDQWLGSVRSWTLVCWFFLTLGLILGGRWAYEELGWGGYWAWDPVENAGLLPWFTATAFLHSLMIQEQRGTMKVWNMVLVITTFFLTIFGTFMTRSGVVQSVHAFGEDNQLALLFILFMAFVLIMSFGLLLWRLPQLRSTSTFESFASREFAFLLNNWILLACAFFVLFATMFPTLSEAVNGQRITVGPPFFNKWMIPMGLVLLFLAGAAPLLAWRRTTVERLTAQFLFPTAAMLLTVAGLAIFWPRTRVLTSILSDRLQLPMSLCNFGLVAFTVASVAQEFWRGVRVRMKQTDGGAFTSLIGLTLAKRRKYGGYVIHVGVALMFFGFGGKAFETMQDYTVTAEGQSFTARDYTFVYRGLHKTTDDHKLAYTAKVDLLAGGSKLAEMHPAKWQYSKFPNEPTSEVAIESHLEDDVYLILTGFEPESKVVNFRVYVNPLVNWVWLGFVFLAFGTAICLVPQRWVDNLSPRTSPRLGKIGEAAVLLLVLAGATAGMVQVARAQPPPSGAPQTPPQYQEEIQQAGGHSAGAGATHLNREDDAAFLERVKAAARARMTREKPGASEAELAARADAEVRQATAVARRLMIDLVCLCGGCKRETIHECKCAFAAQERGKVLERIEGDFSRSGEGDRIYQAVVASFMKDYGGQHVLAVPIDAGFNRLAWIVPYVALAGALVLLYAFGRRWVRRGREAVLSQNARSSGTSTEDEAYAEKLDDELRDTD